MTAVTEAPLETTPTAAATVDTDTATDTATPAADTPAAGAPTRSTLWWLRRVVAIVLFAVVALVALSGVVVPAVTGASTFTITGRSMEPTIPLGSLIVTRPATSADVQIGDIVTYQVESGKPLVATHRVVGMTFAEAGTRYITQGDANEAPDPDPVQIEQIRGTLWYSIPLIGWVNFVLTGSVRGWLVPVVVAGLCAYAGWMFVTAARERRARRGTVGSEPEPS